MNNTFNFPKEQLEQIKQVAEIITVNIETLNEIEELKERIRNAEEKQRQDSRNIRDLTQKNNELQCIIENGVFEASLTKAHEIIHNYASGDIKDFINNKVLRLVRDNDTNGVCPVCEGNPKETIECARLKNKFEVSCSACKGKGRVERHNYTISRAVIVAYSFSCDEDEDKDVHGYSNKYTYSNGKKGVQIKTCNHVRREVKSNWGFVDNGLYSMPVSELIQGIRDVYAAQGKDEGIFFTIKNQTVDEDVEKTD